MRDPRKQDSLYQRCNSLFEMHRDAQDEIHGYKRLSCPRKKQEVNANSTQQLIPAVDDYNVGAFQQFPYLRPSIAASHVDAFAPGAFDECRGIHEIG
jgi:hypothetical protein